MKKVLFVCQAGMSTSLLVTKTLEAAKAKGVELTIEAYSEAEAKNHLDGVSVILLGPQVRFLLGNIKKMVEGKNINVEVIDSISYGRMDGNALLKQITKLLPAE